MKQLFFVPLSLMMFASSHCLAQLLPTMGTVAPIEANHPASLKMEVYDNRVHEIYLSRSKPSPSYTPGHVKITVSRGKYPDQFSVDVAYVDLGDKRILFTINTPPASESDYDIHAIEFSAGMHELFSGKLSEIPVVKASFRQ
jgi:hypothetical protein